MLESLRQLYDNIVDFCREQSDAMMIGGAVLVVLIILIAVVRYFLKQDNSKQEADESLEWEAIFRQASRCGSWKRITGRSSNKNSRRSSNKNSGRSSNRNSDKRKSYRKKGISL